MLFLLGSVEHHPEYILAFYYHSLLTPPARGSGNALSACPPAGILSLTVLPRVLPSSGDTNVSRWPVSVKEQLLSPAF